ncbi:MAG: methionyl-tRNA formyltransferase [Candidatus Doudnabacteria bacterium]|nr:methionyl-tRNA formyltransferase [Candidatus Doudnabacteria bacterium]
MKIIFAGTTEFGIPTLEKLLTLNYQLLTVITQPDKPVGRKKPLTPTPIKLWAEKNGIPVLQPEKIRNSKFEIRNLDPDLMLVAAYGQIIPEEILNIPKYGSINIHGSLLPKYRGPTPIQAAILNGDDATGVTLMLMVERLDEGPVIASNEVKIKRHETFPQLYGRLSLTASELVAKTLPAWFAKKITPQPQDNSQAAYTGFFDVKSGRIDWTKSASEIDRKIRALNPEPGTWTTLNNKSVKILEAEEIPDEELIGLAGKISARNKQLVVKCQTNSLKITKLQPEGKKIMPGADFANGLKDKQNNIFI